MVQIARTPVRPVLTLVLACLGLLVALTACGGSASAAPAAAASSAGVSGPAATVAPGRSSATVATTAPGLTPPQYVPIANVVRLCHAERSRSAAKNPSPLSSPFVLSGPLCPLS